MSATGVQLDSHPDFGFFLRAAKEFAMGDVIMSEAAFLIIPSFPESFIETLEWVGKIKEEVINDASVLHDKTVTTEEIKGVVAYNTNKRVFSEALSVNDEMWKEIEVSARINKIPWSFLMNVIYLILLDENVQKEMLNLYKPLQLSARIELLKSSLPNCLTDSIFGRLKGIILKDYPSHPIKNIIYEQILEKISDLLAIVDCNAFQGFDSVTSEIYSDMSRFNHSCSPNAHAIPISSGYRVVRALKTIPVGSEITISYLSASQLIQPVAKRAYNLFTSKQFNCSCEKCLGMDYSRSFLCSKCNSFSVFAGPDSLLVCVKKSCGRVLKYSEKCSLFEKEEFIAKKVDILEQIVTRMSDPVAEINKIISSCSLLSPAHHLLRTCFSMLADYYIQKLELNFNDPLFLEKAERWTLQELIALCSNLFGIGLDFEGLLGFGNEGFDFEHLFGMWNIFVQDWLAASNFPTCLVNFEVAIQFERLGSVSKQKKQYYGISRQILKQLYGDKHIIYLEINEKYNSA